MDAGEVERGRAVVRQGVADAAAERVDQVFFRMAVGRLVEPLTAATDLPSAIARARSVFLPFGNSVGNGDAS